jgi:hypothetical protein
VPERDIEAELRAIVVGELRPLAAPIQICDHVLVVEDT